MSIQVWLKDKHVEMLRDLVAICGSLKTLPPEKEFRYSEELIAGEVISFKKRKVNDSFVIREAIEHLWKYYKTALDNYKSEKEAAEEAKKEAKEELEKIRRRLINGSNSSFHS